MKLLLDTHIFLWYISADAKLPVKYRQAIQDPVNDVFLSSASIWEAVIKYDLGKLPLPAPPMPFLSHQRSAHGIARLPIDEDSMMRLSGLPPLHRDPFDRMLIAQSMQLNLIIATVDSLFSGYPVTVLAIA